MFQTNLAFNFKKYQPVEYFKYDEKLFIVFSQESLVSDFYSKVEEGAQPIKSVGINSGRTLVKLQQDYCSYRLSYRDTVAINFHQPLEKDYISNVIRFLNLFYSRFRELEQFNLELIKDNGVIIANEIISYKSFLRDPRPPEELVRLKWS